MNAVADKPKNLLRVTCIAIGHLCEDINPVPLEIISNLR
jgi:hypothetical protein